MRSHTSSATAAFVATCRSLGALLPARAQLVRDPYGAPLAHPALGLGVRALAALPRPARALAWAPLAPLLPWTVYMQVRTRVLDDALRDALASGCTQLVLLGAGLDARALRLRDELAAARVFEVDHPATQAHKRRALERLGVSSPARYLPWDFERDALSSLPDALAAQGFSRDERTFTVWEGVTMYLTPQAIEATLAAIAEYSAPGSRLALNYVERDALERPSPAARVVRSAVALVGEPFRTGFDPATLAAALARAGFSVLRDERFGEAAAAYLPRSVRALAAGDRRVHVAERTAAAQRA